MNALARNCIKRLDNKYYFNDLEIPRKFYLKILEGSWNDLSVQVVQKKINRIKKQGRLIESYQLLYEVALSSKNGQYLYGLALEMVANKLLKSIKDMKVEARQLVKANKENHDDASKS